MSLDRSLDTNLSKLKTNEYPGRGIVIGMTANLKHLVQIYWIMGRSENSRNRVFEVDGDFIRTKAFDESKVTDPSLIIYYPVKCFNSWHIVTNGDQTETIYEALKSDKSAESALMTRMYEPDEPHFTPRISVIINNSTNQKAYMLSILKSAFEGKICQRVFFNYDNFIPGVGHCIHTYANNGNPIPSFGGEPFTVPIADSIDDNARTYWETLDQNNRISLLVKYIDTETNKTDFRIINKHSS